MTEWWKWLWLVSCRQWIESDHRNSGGIIHIRHQFLWFLFEYVTGNKNGGFDKQEEKISYSDIFTHKN